MSEDEEKSGHGGKREGSGRKSSGKIRRSILIKKTLWGKAIDTGNASGLIEKLLSDHFKES